MPRTPSPPPRRLRTPPAPLHGPEHDSFEPYSPLRRSARTAAAAAAAAQQQEQLSSPTRARVSRVPHEATPKGKKVRLSQGLSSPPSSPISPNNRPAPRSTRRAIIDPFDSDAPANGEGASSSFENIATDVRQMLPTPHKTPRKRLFHEAKTKSTARVLFADRPTNADDAMPTPRKGRRAMNNSFLDTAEVGGDDFAIYTDTKDRIPSNDEGEDNPFISKRGRGSRRAKAAPKSTDKSEMQARADRDEGIIYMFRGKKVLRPYANDPAHPSDSAPEQSEEEILRHAGTTARRPLRRSCVKPRKLFQEEIRALHPEDTDEEAETEIEQHLATPSGRKTRSPTGLGIQVGPEAPPTPPATVRKTTRQTQLSFTRVVKSSSSSGRPKRGGDAMEGASQKRSRTNA